MRQASSRMYPHTVSLTLNTWGTDVDGGRQVSSSRSVSYSGCLVLFGQTMTVIEDAAELGTRRVTQVKTTTVHFPTSPGLHSDDLITWVDLAGVSHIFRVNGFSGPGGDQSHWVATVKEGE